jgi:ribose-phosphate pyrophosphokinase
MLTDALRRAFGEVDIHLNCPYLPYARQDRVCAPGESLSLKVFCDIINSLNFKTVTVADVHSDVALALLDRATSIPVERLVGLVTNKLNINGKKPIVVAPDAGAIKKVLAVAKTYDTTMVRADKIRDVDTGAIKETVVYTSETDMDFLVVDDICDGGKTFIELAKVLYPKTTGKLYLYVTHGIFSKGLEPLEDWYDNIYCPYPFPGTGIKGLGGFVS